MENKMRKTKKLQAFSIFYIEKNLKHILIDKEEYEVPCICSQKVHQRKKDDSLWKPIHRSIQKDVYSKNTRKINFTTIL